MKIMMLAAADSIHAVRWANEYVARGHELYLVAVQGHQERSDKIDPRVKVYYLRFGGMLGYYINVHEFNQLWKKIKPDVVNVHYASGYGTLARLSCAHPIVLSVWGSDVYHFPFKRSINRKIVVKNLRHADAIASTSKAMAKQVQMLLGNENIEICVTPFGVETDKFYPRVKNKDDRYFWFGIVKKLTYIYGIDLVIKSFNIFYNRWKQAGSKGREPRLYICGKGDNKEDFEQLRDSFGLGKEVTIKGYVPHDEIPELLSRFDVFCLGSNEESFGVSALEAMACGVPIIATMTDGFREVMIDNVTGYLVPIGDETEMASKMWTMYHDDEMRKRMGEAGRKHVIENYSWKDNVSIMEQYMRGVVDTWRK